MNVTDYKTEFSSKNALGGGGGEVPEGYKKSQFSKMKPQTVDDSEISSSDFVSSPIAATV